MMDCCWLWWNRRWRKHIRTIPIRIRDLRFIIVQRHAGIIAQLNHGSWNVAAARQTARVIAWIALQPHCAHHAVYWNLNFRQVVHVRVRVRLRLRGPRFLARERVARHHGVLLRPGHLRAVFFVFQNLHFAPLVQFIRAEHPSGTQAAHVIPVVAGAIGTVIPLRARPRARWNRNIPHPATCAGALIA